MTKNRLRNLRWALTFSLTIALGLSSMKTEALAFGLSAPSIYLIEFSSHFVIPSLQARAGVPQLPETVPL